MANNNMAASKGHRQMHPRDHEIPSQEATIVAGDPVAAAAVEELDFPELELDTTLTLAVRIDFKTPSRFHRFFLSFSYSG
jgi:hypothetical protein